MGDTGDDFKAWNEQDKTRRYANDVKIKKLLAANDIPFSDVGNCTLLIRTAGLKIDIYASKNKLKHGSKFIQTDPNGIINYIKKQLKKPSN